jgi:hypothetical protein
MGSSSALLPTILRIRIFRRKPEFPGKRRNRSRRLAAADAQARAGARRDTGTARVRADSAGHKGADPDQGEMVFAAPSKGRPLWTVPEAAHLCLRSVGGPAQNQ